jgi:hypothetical protein
VEFDTHLKRGEQMKKCEYCKDFDGEKEDIEITGINVGGSFYNYNCPITHCPACGKLLDKYNKEDK